MYADFRSRITVAEQIFEIDGVTVTLEWTSVQENFFHSYQFTISPFLPFNNTSGSTRIQFKVSYNTPYNLSFLGTPLCWLDNVTAFFEFYYSKSIIHCNTYRS